MYSKNKYYEIRLLNYSLLNLSLKSFMSQYPKSIAPLLLIKSTPTNHCKNGPNYNEKDPQYHCAPPPLKRPCYATVAE